VIDELSKEKNISNYHWKKLKTKTEKLLIESDYSEQDEKDAMITIPIIIS